MVWAARGGWLVGWEVAGWDFVAEGRFFLWRFVTIVVVFCCLGGRTRTRHEMATQLSLYLSLSLCRSAHKIDNFLAHFFWPAVYVRGLLFVLCLS